MSYCEPKTWERPKEWDAPEGKTFVCVCCGRHGKQRDKIGDESCFLNADLFDTPKLIFNQDGRLVVRVSE